MLKCLSILKCTYISTCIEIFYPILQIKLRCEELEKENSTLRHQKEMLQEYHQKQKSRADNLDIQRKSLQDSLAHLTENEVHMYIHTYLESIFFC